MSEAFEKHKAKRISEMSERIRNYRSKKKVIEIKIFGQPAKKVQKNISEI